jgi:hypothetical protein
MMVKIRDKLCLEEGSQETDERKQAADKWCGNRGGGVASTGGGSIRGSIGGSAGGSVFAYGGIGNGVLGVVAGEGLILGGLDIEVCGRETQTLANGLEGKFGVVF